MIGELDRLERQAHRNLNQQIALETVLLRLRGLLLHRHDPTPA
jgi:hypothetical protein